MLTLPLGRQLGQREDCVNPSTDAVTWEVHLGPWAALMVKWTRMSSLATSQLSCPDAHPGMALPGPY